MRVDVAALTVTAVLLSTSFSSGCATLFPPEDTNFVEVDSLADEQLAPTPYKIRGGDKMQVTVFKQESLSGEVLVREDGQITVPLVGDVAVLGKTPPEASIEIAGRLSQTGFIDKPSVSVAVLETRQPSFAVVGQVKQPGSFELQPGTTVLDCIALAGGLDEFANKEKIFVIRKNRRAPATPTATAPTTTPPTAETPATTEATTEAPAATTEATAPTTTETPTANAAATEKQNRIRFTWAKLSRSDGNALRFRVEDGDVIVVE